MKYKTTTEVYEYILPTIHQEHAGEVPLRIQNDEQIHFLQDTAHIHPCSQLKAMMPNRKTRLNLLPIFIHKKLL